MPDLVMIHGLLGWAESERPLFGWMPDYFPLTFIRQQWTEGDVVAVELGAASSDHDRACEAFAHLMGLQVDYGEEHSRHCCHARFGMDFRGKGLLKRWDAQNPVHLIGHSFGGNTAVALYNMIAEDYWGLGTGSDWVASVSAVCSPLRGCSLPFLLGLVEVTDQEGCTRHTVEPGSFTHGMVASCCLIIKAQDRWPSVFKRLFNFKSEQWAEHNTWSNLVSARHPYVLSGDNMMSEIAPRTRRRALRGRMENLSKTYLIAITSDALAPLSPQQLLRRLIFSAAALSGLSMSALILAFQRRASLLRLWDSLKARSWRRLALPSLGVLSGLLLLTRKCHRSLYEQLLLLVRPIMYSYFLRPYLRLSSYSVHRAAKELSPKSALVASDAEQGANDGLIDVIAQRCLDCPRLTRQQQPGGRQSRSQMHVPAARVHALARAYSYGHVDNGEEEKPLQRGRWHELHVPDSDHCLGTWFDQRSEKMYENLFKILRKRLH